MTDTPRAAAIDHATATTLAATEYQRTVEAWAALSGDDWARPTDNAAWDVHAMAAHVYGMARMAASLVEMARQQRAAAGGGIDALTAHQVAAYGGLGPDALVAGLRTTAPKALRARRRTPGFVRSRRLPEAQVVGERREWWTIGFLLDVVLTRDPWMHRADLARATGRPMELTSDHDGLLVADVVSEWAERHGRPYDLTLTGPAGGRWQHGTGGEVVDLDAVDFCRILSGRGTGPGLLATLVPF